MKKLLFILIAALTFAACTKEKESIATGNIRYTNNSPSNNRYEMFLDGKSLGLIKGNTYIDKPATVGTHAVKAVQYEGYVLYPTIKEASLTVGKNGVVTFAFP